jgi:hypothetical protein
MPPAVGNGERGVYGDQRNNAGCVGIPAMESMGKTAGQQQSDGRATIEQWWSNSNATEMGVEVRCMGWGAAIVRWPGTGGLALPFGMRRKLAWAVVVQVGCVVCGGCGGGCEWLGGGVMRRWMGGEYAMMGRRDAVQDAMQCS